MVEETSVPAESGFGEHVVELASPFSTFMCNGWVVGAVVHVETVFVDVVVKTVDLTAGAASPVDLSVGVTVAEGLVKAAGFASLSTRGLMGIVPVVAGVPTLFGSGRGREEDESSKAFGDCT